MIPVVLPDSHQYLRGYCRCHGPRSAVSRALDSYVRGPGIDTRSGLILSFLLPLIQEGQLSVTGESMCTKYLGGLSLPRKSVVRLTNRPDMTLDVYRGHKTTTTKQVSHVSESCNMASMKNNNFHVVSCITREKENSNHHGNYCQQCIKRPN